MNEINWIARHDELHKAFDTDAISTASRPELERHLITLANIKMKAEDNQNRNEQRAHVIRHFLQIRIAEELQKRALELKQNSVRLQRRSVWISTIAVVVSVIAMALTITQALHGP